MSLVAAVLLLLGLNLWMAPKVALRESPTSLGVERQGYKAAYDLLLELGVPVRRSYVQPDAIPAKGSLWLVSPSFLNADLRDDDAAGSALLRWVRKGGTAVVFGDSESDWKRLDLKRGHLRQWLSKSGEGRLRAALAQARRPGACAFCGRR